MPADFFFFSVISNTSGCHTVSLLQRPSSIFVGSSGRKQRLMVLTGALFLVAQTDPTVFSPAEIFVMLRVCSCEGAVS